MKKYMKFTLLMTIILEIASVHGMQAVTIDQLHLQSQLYEAARRGGHEKITLLVAAGAKVNLPDNDSLRALMWAALNGHLECVRAVISAKADVNLADRLGRTAFLTPQM